MVVNSFVSLTPKRKTASKTKSNYNKQQHFRYKDRERNNYFLVADDNDDCINAQIDFCLLNC